MLIWEPRVPNWEPSVPTNGLPGRNSGGEAAGPEKKKSLRTATIGIGNIMSTTLQTSRVMREARLRLHLTQFTLSRRVGCSESRITKIETGRATAPQWLKEAIARELDIHTWEVGV